MSPSYMQSTEHTVVGKIEDERMDNRKIMQSFLIDPHAQPEMYTPHLRPLLYKDKGTSPAHDLHILSRILYSRSFLKVQWTHQ